MPKGKRLTVAHKKKYNDSSDSSEEEEESDSEGEEGLHLKKFDKVPPVEGNDDPPSSDNERELLLYEDDPFEIIPPPQQPAGTKRKGTGYINANLPQPPFMVMIVGPRKSGKTVTLYNMLQNKKGAYGKAVIRSNIILYSPTYTFDKTLESLNIKWIYGPPTQPDTIINHLKTSQSVFKQSDAMADTLLVLEDVTNIPEVWRTLLDLGYTGRHFGINTIAVAHKMSSIIRGVRTQVQQWMLFKPHEESETEWVLYTFARKKSREIFEAAFSRAWSVKYNFIYIDFERDGGIENIYRSGFNDPLFSPEEVAALENIRLYRPSGEVALNPDKDPDDPLPNPERKASATSAVSSSSIGQKRKIETSKPLTKEKRATKRRKNNH